MLTADVFFSEFQTRPLYETQVFERNLFLKELWWVPSRWEREARKVVIN